MSDDDRTFQAKGKVMGKFQDKGMAASCEEQQEGQLVPSEQAKEMFYNSGNVRKVTGD